MLPGAGITRIRFERSEATQPTLSARSTELPCCTDTLAIHCQRHITRAQVGCWVLFDPTPASFRGESMWCRPVTPTIHSGACVGRPVLAAC